MFERGHGGFGRIGEGREGPGGSKCAPVVGVVRSVGNIAGRAVAGSQSPGVGAIALKMFGIRNAISAVDQGNVAVVFKIRRAEAIAQTVGIESEIGVVRKKEGTSGANADIELYAVVRVSVRIVIPVLGAGPSLAIRESHGILACPAGIVITGGNAVCRRCHCKKIGNHHFVEANERMVDTPSPKRRPMPVQEMALRRLAIPIPLDALPELGDALMQSDFFRS